MNKESWEMLINQLITKEFKNMGVNHLLTGCLKKDFSFLLKRIKKKSDLVKMEYVLHRSQNPILIEMRKIIQSEIDNRKK